MTAPTTPPPPVDLTRLEQLAESATPGPWRTERWSLGLTIEAQGGYLLESDDGAMPVVEREPDAEFIAALRNAAPQLLAASRAVERVRALHTPDPAGWCDGCEFSWPCGTIRALDGSDA